ncbi:MAG TPA: hypothetical protein VGK99_21805 [Acidobacteriota bacterium]|jgi:hypothetical protein
MKRRRPSAKITTRKPIAPPAKVFKDKSKEPFRKRKHKKEASLMDENLQA